MSWVKIKRHVMIKHDYSPYDATKADYFELRNLKYKKMPLRLG